MSKYSNMLNNFASNVTAPAGYMDINARHVIDTSVPRRVDELRADVAASASASPCSRISP